MRVFTHALLFGALICSSLAAQDSIDRAEALQDFRQAHPQARFQGPLFGQKKDASDEVRTATTVFGTTLATGASPLESARAHVDEVRPLLAPEIGLLEPEIREDGEVVLGAMFDRASGAYRFSTFRLQQTYGGIPVFRSGVGFLVRNDSGFPLVMSTFDVKDLSTLDVSPLSLPSAGGVSGAMEASAHALLDEQLRTRGFSAPEKQELEVTDERLVVWAGTGDLFVRPTFAMEFVATRGSIRTAPQTFQRHLVLASVATGEILYSEDMVQQFVDVSGTVTGFATQGLNSLECDPEVQIPLPYIQAEVVGGNSVFADAGGNFVIPHGGASNVTVRSPLRGQWFEVFDDTAGSTTPEVSTVVTPPGPANLVHNPAPTSQFPTANVNAYVEANRVRDFTLFYAPNYPTIGTQTFFDLVVNQDSAFGITSCNAVYTGSELMFWRNAGGCNNTSFSDVVHHEYGHHLIAVTGNGQGQLGEGSGDCMGVLIQDDPVLGQGFQSCNVGIRNANNNHQYPCNGGIHDCGQLISGCVWDLRNELVVTEPASYLDIGASLFVNMLIVRGQMLPGNDVIDPTITIIYLELDDDDSDIGNGTPHYNEIATAFGAHNMDAPPLDLLSFAYPSGRPESVDPSGGSVAFTVEVTAQADDPASGTGVLYLDRGMGLETFAMGETSPNVYEVVFPALECGQSFSYYFSADTVGGQTAFDPPSAPDAVFSALAAGSVASSFEDDFEANLGWSVSGSATDGQWTRGVPIGGGDRGDPAVDGDGSGSCYLTDNVDGNSDVDGGSTILTSPLLDASTFPGEEALISYRRWYSNHTGSDPGNDVFEVEISNNNGGTWIDLETVGPAGPEASGGWYERTFRIADVIAPTANMRVRFTASDLNAGSVVEAGVDAVKVRIVTCDPTCGSSETYCAATANSSGNVAQIGFSGQTSLGAGNFTLEVTDAAPDKAGLFYFGGARIQTPFGDGFRCVGTGHYGGTFRLFPLANTDAQGQASRALNFGAGNASNIVSNAETNFQFWFRDPMGPGGQGFNLSDGLSVTFCP